MKNNNCWLKRTTVLAASAVLFASCMVPGKGPGPSTTPPKNAAEASLHAQTAIDRGDFAKGLRLYSEAYGSYHDQTVASRYSDAGNQIKQGADLAFQAGDYAKSGMLYTLLLQSRITERRFCCCPPL